MSAFYKSTFSDLSTPYPSSPSITRDPQSTTFPLSNSTSIASGLHRSGSQRKMPKLSYILSQIRRNIVSPFALAHHHNPSFTANSLSSSYPPSLAVPIPTRQNSANSIQEKIRANSDLHRAPPPHHIPDPRDPSKRTFFARAFRSDESNDSLGDKEYLGLPFRLSVYTAQDHVTRNVPYLRHSWNRIDFIAIVSFWIAFILAELGAERSTSRHIAVFRALSVLRTSRLLAVTSGTTVCFRLTLS